MADISNEIKNFREAVYGEEVRGSMISLAEKLNEVSEATAQAEKKRVTAEIGRVNAEKKRQTNTAAAIERNDTATERANTAASTAETAGTTATRAASNASAKAALADTAAKKADTAAESANDAAGLAEAAKTVALEAAETANTAGTAATKAASNANSKASDANTAAGEAVSAAIDANSAAEEARRAVEELKGGIGIDDNVVSENKTYSSKKIEEMAEVNWISEFKLKSTQNLRSESKYENGRLTVFDAQPTETNHAYTRSMISVKPNTDYTISWKSERTGKTGGGIWVNGTDNSIIDKEHMNELNGSFTFNTGEKEEIFVLFIAAVATKSGGVAGDSATFWDIMLVEGENVAPYMENVKDIVRETAGIRADFLPIALDKYKVFVSGDDLNSCFAKGSWVSTGAEVSKLLKNIPEGLKYGFVLHTLEITRSNYTRQIIIEAATNSIYTRCYNVSGFEEWVRIADNNDTDDLNQRFALVSKGDILDVKKSGTYFVGGAVTGKPEGIENTNGCLIVSYVSESNRVYQYIGTPYGTIYVKRFVGSVNDPGWRKVLMEMDIVTDFDSTDFKQIAAAPLVKQLKEDVENLNSKFALVNSGDFSEIINSGIYYVANKVTGKPTDTGGMYIVSSPYNDGITQVGLYVPNNTTRPYVVYKASSITKTYQL